ncbi:MAG: hypothetical protein JSR15_10950, partial [Proteobacteria bacterium]|nr:hypothetical protein [Pseudomonadota bacterium]
MRPSATCGGRVIAARATLVASLLLAAGCGGLSGLRADRNANPSGPVYDRDTQVAVL